MSHSVLADGIRSVIGGGTPSRSVGSYWTGDIPWASVKDLSDNRLTLYDTEEHITPAALRASASNLVPPGTVIVCTRMAVGRAAMTMVPTAINQDLKALFTNERLRPRYLLHLLQILKPKLEAKAIGSTVKGIGVRDLLAVPVLLPDTTGQDRIIEVLDRADKAIQYSASIIARMRLIKVGLIHDLLTRGLDESGQLRDFIMHPKNFYGTKLGVLPSSWRVCPITEATDEPASITIGPFGSDLTAGDYRDHGTPVVFVRDVREEGFNWKSGVYVSSDKAYRLSAHDVRQGDLLATKMGLPPGVACVYPATMPPGIVTADIIRLRPRTDYVNVEWLTTYVNSYSVAAQVRKITGGVTRPKITLRDFRKLYVALPTITEQERIISALKAQDHRIEVEEAVRDKLVLQKQGLLADLLTGRISAHA